MVVHIDPDHPLTDALWVELVAAVEHEDGPDILTALAQRLLDEGVPREVVVSYLAAVMPTASDHGMDNVIATGDLVEGLCPPGRQLRPRPGPLAGG